MPITIKSTNPARIIRFPASLVATWVVSTISAFIITNAPIPAEHGQLQVILLTEHDCKHPKSISA
jgi:hypothetical protein